MKPILITGISIVNLALISYTVAIVALIRKKIVSKVFLSFLTIGVIFDITSTVCMMIGSSKGMVTVHGIIGYSSLLGMLTDTLFSYRYTLRNGINTAVSQSLRKASLVAYAYWIAAYFTGSVIVMMR